MNTDDKSESDKSPSLSNINKIIHEPARLMIMSYLYVVKSADFVFLKNQTGLTWGNLSSHITKLETVGYVDIEKRFKGKKPQTMLKLNQKGREAYELYRKNLNKVLLLCGSCVS